MKQTSNKKVLVCGGRGFISGHMFKRLKELNCWVRSVDLKADEFSDEIADETIIGDLRDPQVVTQVMNQSFDIIIQLAADMGGAGYVFTGENDAQIMHNSALVNLNVL